MACGVMYNVPIITKKVWNEFAAWRVKILRASAEVVDDPDQPSVTDSPRPECDLTEV
jgi:hypothetical protein